MIKKLRETSFYYLNKNIFDLFFNYLKGIDNNLKEKLKDKKSLIQKQSINKNGNWKKHATNRSY